MAFLPRALHLRARARACYERLLSAGSSRRELEAAFRELEDLCTRAPQDLLEAVLCDERIRELRPRVCRLRAAYEYDREKHWADRISRHPEPALALAAYPNYRGHEAIVDYELGQIAGRQERPLQVLFVGGGPLPLTPICLARHGGLDVTSLDREREACEISRALIDRLPLGGRLRVLHCDAMDVTGIDGYDVVWLAMLTGDDKAAKLKIARHMLAMMSEGQRLVLRSASGYQQLFYVAVGADDLDAEGVRCRMAGSIIVAQRT
jgi:nicotianamine synthase